MEGRFPRGLLGGLIALAALCALLAAGGASQAAWTSPGTGTTYTMLTLTASAGGDVDLVGAPPSCHFRIDSDITISNQDTLVIDAGCLIEFDNNEYLNIRGRLHLNGTAALPVSFIPTSGSSSPGLYGGLRFLGQAFAPSNVDNLTVRQAVNGVRCDGCRGLALHNLTGTALSGDLVQVVGGGSDVVVEDVRMVVSTFTSQTIVALQGAANVSGRNLSAPQAAVALLVWNATNVTFVGPIGATAASYGAAWVDNASGVSIEGLWGAGYPTGLRVTRSTNVAVTNATFAVPSLYGAFFQDAEGVALDELTVANASGAGLWLELVRNATVGGASLSATGLALAAVSVSNLTVTNLSARSAAGALWAVGAQGLLVDAASLTGGAGAGARIQGSAGVVLRAVAAANSSVGFRVEASADVRLEQCSATGGSDHGLEASSTVNLTVEACALSNNAGRGAYLRSVNGFRVLSVDADANAQDGFLLQDSNGSMGGVRARGNAKDGVRLTGASSLDGANLTVSGNTWGGVQLDTGSSANVARLVAAGNGANGTYVAAGAYLALTAARFEDNSAWGLRVEAGGAASWNVTAADEAVVSNPVVMAGAWAGRAGGALWVSNSTVSLRSAAGGVLVMDFSGGSQLALDRATLERADPTSRWALRLTGGAAFVAANSTLSHGGLTGSAPAVNATRSDLALADTLVMGFEGGLRLNASTALLVRVSFSGGSGGAIDARVGSSVAVADVRVEALASGPAVSLDGGAALTGARLNVSGAPAQGIVVAGGSSVDLDLLAAEGLAGCALCLSGGSSAFLRNGTVSTSGPGPAVGPGPAADVRLHDTQVTATAGAAVSVNASGFLILLASRLEAAGTAMAAGGGAWVIVRNSTIVSTAGEALAAQAASWVDVRDSTFDGALGGLRAQSVLFVEVHDSALTALVGAALRVASSGVVRVSGLNLTAGPGATGAAFDGNVFNASGLTVGGGDGSTGVLVANASGSVLSASSVKVGGGGAVGVASTATVGLVLREVAVVAGGSAEGIRVVGGSLWATNVSVSVGANATALRLDQASGSQLADVDVSSGGGGGSGILSVSTTGLTVARLRVSVGAGGVGVNLSAPLAGLLENLLVDGGRTGLASAGAGLTLRNATFLNQTGTALDVRDASSLEASDILASPAGIVLQNVSGARLQRLEVRGSTQGALRLLQTSGVTVADALLSPASGVGLDIFQSSQLSADGLRVLGGDTGVRFADAPGATVAGLVVDGAATSVLATGSTALTLEGPTLRGATAAALSATG
ncbi:MAG TPA: right-handed parallel beta-helix repeat-containing protein, partial [Candidatus Thermoplasmatota archaeon]